MTMFRILVFVVVMLVSTAPFLTGCESSRPTETALFEEAEVHYRLGNYDGALSGYQAFLRTYPLSPLAETAEMRLRNIKREVSSVMGRQGMPRPVYHGSARAGSATTSSSTSNNNPNTKSPSTTPPLSTLDSSQNKP